MLPDFEKGLQGVAAGDEKTFKVKFPKDYHAEDLAGKKADFSITVHRVEAEILPELDDDFAAMFNVSEGGLKQFMADVRENMERESDQKAKSEVREQVMEALLEANRLEIPQSLKHQEMHSLQREAMQRMGLEDSQQEAMPLENFSAAAERRVALGLSLRQVLSDKALTIDETMLRARVEELCAGYENADDMVEMYLSNPQVMHQIEPMVIEQQAIDWILENGKVSSRKISFEEFMNAPAS
jgi:trigger factor